MNRFLRAVAGSGTPAFTTLELNNGHNHLPQPPDRYVAGVGDDKSTERLRVQEEENERAKETKVPSPTRIVSTRLASFSPMLATNREMVYAAEQYRIARTKILQVLHTPFRLVVTSSSVGDGKSISALNLATAMALKGETRTLLIDADLRGARIHHWLDVPRTPGLADVLAGTCRFEDALFSVRQLPGLHVLTAGNLDGNSTELLDSSRWRTLVHYVRQTFAQVIVDSPPIDVVADFDLIAAVCDGIALVVRPDHSDRTECLNAIERLRPRLTGVLVNGAPEWFLWKKRTYYSYLLKDKSREEEGKSK